jgi:adenylate cyclase
MKLPFPKSHNTRGLLICLGVMLFVLLTYPFGLYDNLENRAIDFRFKMRGAHPTSSDIVVVAIDEPSMAELGRWPWPRATHAKLTRLLHKAGARVVVFDSFFSERDRNDGAGDREFAKAAEDSGMVAIAFPFLEDVHEKIFAGKPLLPYAELNENVYTGFANYTPDSDGVLRRANLYAIDGETVYPSLSVAGLALSEDKTIDEILKELPVEISSDPLLAENSIFINYRGTYYDSTSYVDVLNGKAKADKFKDKIVFVGATAAALADLKSVPFASLYPGVMVHANVVDNLRAKDVMTEVPSEITGLVIIAIGLLFGFLLPRLSTWNKLIVFVAVIGGGILASMWFFSHQNLLIHMVPPLFVGLGSYAGLLFYQVVVEVLSGGGRRA